LIKTRDLRFERKWGEGLPNVADDEEGVKVYIVVDPPQRRRNVAMDWKLAARTSGVLVSGTLLLGGCMTPGLQYRNPPGFSSTFQHFDPNWQAVAGHDGSRCVTPAGGEAEMQDAPKMSARTDVRHEKLMTPN